MRLSELTTGMDVLERPAGGTDPVITGVHYRSQSVGPGGLFVALPGLRSDGHRFVEDAARRGAAAALVQRPVSAPVPNATTL